MKSIIVIAHNLRSSHNVGSLLRTAEGLGVVKVMLTGYTPYPEEVNDQRLPHEAQRATKQIDKTALGAHTMIPWEYHADVVPVLKKLKKEGFVIAAIEQTRTSKALPAYQPPQKIALVLGREVEGIEPEILAVCDIALEIPMYGKKESFNVVQAAAMALYHCRFYFKPLSN